ncbi:hypothetical protein HGRIS_006487 [Hohenbuehelia grisea]|uniref:ERCC4 domain-containing protein n=1 Tax=Hohenbuehelia grisea TaxID=104357 RepID=A0ABR3K019_9AGAR
MSTLLSFHAAICAKIVDPVQNDLLILAPGLGLRRVLCALMKTYDDKKNLVLLLNATPEEESEIGEELSLIGCRKPGLRTVGYETGSKERQEIYKQGGLISVTSRILVVDILQSDIPTHLITGLLILHAEKVTALALEAFIVRLYRQKNKDGFLKAFTDEPEHITSGFAPLNSIMKELQLKRVHIYARFQADVQDSLKRRRADYVEVSPGMTKAMEDIHHAVIECMTLTLAELKRSNTAIDLDDFNVENAYFRSFELVVRKQLDSVWHKVGPRTKQLVNDLGTLRRLLHYLLTYDALQFHSYLETLIAANTTTQTGGARQHQSPWMVTNAGHIIFDVAKKRCYVMNEVKGARARHVIDVDEDAWDALDEIEGRVGGPGPKNDSTDTKFPPWIPAGMEPILEELPKWSYLAEILQEIEGEIVRQESIVNEQPSGSNTVLVMSSSTRICSLITEFLSSLDPTAPRGAEGRDMMLQKLRLYLWWKGKLSERKRDGKSHFQMPDGRHRDLHQESQSLSEALKRKDKERADRVASRRRVRGGVPSSNTSSRPVVKSEPVDLVRMDGEILDEAHTFADFLTTQSAHDWEILPVSVGGVVVDLASGDVMSEFDDQFGLLPPEQTVLVRAFSDDSDDRMLAEIQPKFIVMFEPNMAFIRRIEVYRATHPGLAVRVYHMTYANSCEEHKFLAGMRREKESFERLIKEHASLPLTFDDPYGSSHTDALVKTISTRAAGGRRDLSKEPSRVIIDVREFRSTLPSLLHAAGLEIIPATLTVGDYILSPDMCVERKSLSDLIASFTSGRLYTQCELMSVHYKQPILLIEFDEDKAFSLEIVSDFKSYVKPTGKYPAKKPGSDSSSAVPSLQSKIVLLLLQFPRVRIIWASSSYETADIFKDLKHNNAEPDTKRAIAIGVDDESEAGAGINASAEELLRCLPGITAKNVHYVMSRVRSVRELCELSLVQVQAILGAEPGKKCWDFMHQGEKPATSHT